MKKALFAGVVLAFVPVGASAQISTQDLGFIQQTTHGDLVSVQEGQTAANNSSNPAVRNFAQGEIQYHTTEGQTLASIIQPTGLSLPTTMSPCVVWQAELLQQTTGAPFDQAYLQATIYNHQRMVDALQGEIQNGTDANLKAYAQQALPTIQSHLQEAQGLLGGGPVAAGPGPQARIEFPSGGYQISPEGRQMLASYAQKLAGTQQAKVTATGYTDNAPIGPALAREGITSNEILSQKRADSVKQYLTSQGVGPDVVEARGMGTADPVASNDTPGGRAQNRRVDLTATSALAPTAAVGTSGQTASVACQWL
jgi:chemotaxis protein MotB